jgi:biofilm PGA synthesis lipoprotein PgaB
MKRWMFVFLAFMLWSMPVRSENTYTVLSFHDIIDTLPGQRAEQNSTANFAAYLRWIHENGYNPISVDDVLAARAGTQPLPERAVMLTFDDGYESFYSRAFPLLKAYGYPGVLALVGSWLEVPAGQTVPWGDDGLPRENFLTWDQIREVANSGLVEIASHSYDLHHGILGNPQGNEQPALATRSYDPKTGKYENAEAYRKRVRKDLATNSKLIERETGKRPRVMVWPYGAYNGAAIDIAREVGMPIAMTLDTAVNRPSGDLSVIGRLLLMQDPPLDSFVDMMRNPVPDPILRTVRVDLDAIYDPDPEKQQANLGALLDRIYRYGITKVMVKGFSDTGDTGMAQQLYFPNRHLPMRADLFNRVTWQLKTRSGVKVYAWLPVFGFDFGSGAEISPSDPRARRRVREIYEDMAAYSHLDGLAFLEDETLAATSDASPEVRIEFTRELTQAALVEEAPLATVGSIAVPPVLDPASSQRFARDLSLALQAYDHAGIVALPPPEAADRMSWLRKLTEAVGQHPDGLRRSVFELPTLDFHNGNRPIKSQTLREQMRLLVSSGVLNFGYFPDDFINDHPKAQLVHGAISAKTYPFIR